MCVSNINILYSYIILYYINIIILHYTILSKEVGKQYFRVTDK